MRFHTNNSRLKYEPPSAKIYSIKRSDVMPTPLISRGEVNKAVDEFLQRGGKITKITDEDIKNYPLKMVGFGRAYTRESKEWLDGDQNVKNIKAN